MKNKTERAKIRNAKRMRKLDATTLNLPHNRFQVFWDTLKIRWDIYLKIGGLLFLFAIPLFLVVIFANIYQLSLIQSYAQGTIDALQYRSASFYLTIFSTLLEAIMLLVIAIAMSGIARIIKRLIFYEPIQFRDDFFLGVKENYKPYLAITSIFAIIYFVSLTMFKLSSFAGDITLMSKVLYYIPLVLALIIFIPAFCLIYYQVGIYKNTISGYIKNGFILFIKFPWFWIIGVNIIFIPIYFLFMRNMYVILILGASYLLFILPIAIIIGHIYACYIFDIYINKDNYPSIYDKGIYRLAKSKQEIIDINEINKGEKNDDK